MLRGEPGIGLNHNQRGYKTMDLKRYLRLDDKVREHLADVDRRYRMMYEDPANAEPMFVVNVASSVPVPTWEERLADPMVMLKAELDGLRSHLELRDDRVATVRVQFGTSQVAAAFGCDVVVPKNSLPAAASHVVPNTEDSFTLQIPPLNAGWYGKLRDWTDQWLEQLPEGVHIQHPDIQSPFNNAHLIRGNDILLDFFDKPAAVEAVLDRVTDFMIAMVRDVKRPISHDDQWFYDWGSLWKGYARISNCSMHMISPEFYRDHVLARDIRFFDSVGGGRMHYCGTADAVIDEFFKVPSITGLDYDMKYHDLWALSERAPARVTLLQWAGEATLARLFKGDWPKKRNLIFNVAAGSIEEGRALLARLRAAVRK
ncbi:MAG: hypothetical protein A2498_16150 [Lentisphaerae bacterium RIFOXYC12_FULL_60_16]|nr:MAG: hypothetical protein A2498_16150 [Lentisphaerae bacterium RIFOXYC12_FULL_60_16]OGV85989.1 MAG: hypothetical protein A2340_08030 [Lentisphaerae bacterium RIFOXYB12_FULL_60_10]